MEKWNDQLKEIYFRAGKCTLYKFAKYYKANSDNKLLPNQFILLVFKVMASLMLKLYEKGYYYTDGKPQNIILELSEELSTLSQKNQQYDIKFIDFGSLTDQL